MKCHNHKAQGSRGTKRRREEEQIKTKQTPYMKPQMHKQRRTYKIIKINVCSQLDGICIVYICLTLCIYMQQ